MRFFCYNMHKGIGGRDRRYRLERIIAVIESQNPDLVCLQEVARGTRRSRYDDQPRLLADYFRPEGLLMKTSCASEEEARALLRYVEAHGSGR